ncbi:hypothetical protein O1M63_06470 [Streptomyces mirabilis]|nr:hypothetical protein [Streptomyces mirabilis]
MLPKVLRSELAAQGVHADTPAARPAPPAGPDPRRPARHRRRPGPGPVLRPGAARGRDAAALHSQCVRLLRALPEFRQAQASAGQLLDLLARAATPRMAPPVPPAAHPALTVLRPGHPHADVICLVTAPGVPAGSYDLFVRGHRGPEEIVAVHGDGAPGVLPAALHQASGPGRRLVLCGCGPGEGGLRTRPAHAACSRHGFGRGHDRHRRRRRQRVRPRPRVRSVLTPPP